MVLTTAAVVPGAWMQDAVIAQLNKSAVAITKGKVLYLDPADENFKLAPTGGTSTRYAVAVKDALAADTKVEACVEGHVFVTADGAIPPHAAVKVSAATAGEVQEGVITLDADQNAVCGHYAGKVNNNERDGLSLAAAADGDVILMRIGGMTH